MAKVVEYRILEHRFKNELVNIVNDYIKKGWQPIGGVLYHNVGTSGVFVQAVIRKEAT